MIKPYDSVELKYALEIALYKNKMENELNESEKSYRELVNNSMVAIYKTNLNGDIIFANNAMAELFDFRSVKFLQRKKLHNSTKIQMIERESFKNYKKKGIYHITKLTWFQIVVIKLSFF